MLPTPAVAQKERIRRIAMKHAFAHPWPDPRAGRNSARIGQADDLSSHAGVSASPGRGAQGSAIRLLHQKPRAAADQFRHRCPGSRPGQRLPSRQQGHLSSSRASSANAGGTSARPCPSSRSTSRCPMARRYAGQLAQALKAHPDALAVCSTLSETSTGVGHDIAAFGKLVAPTPALLLVDAVSGLGAMECRTDDWHIDICCTGSQKSLMMPPAWRLSPSATRPGRSSTRTPTRAPIYFDLKKARKSLETSGDTPFTIANTLIRAMKVSLKKIKDEGLDNILARQARNAQAARAGMLALGMEIFPSPPNNALTVGKMPDGVDSSVVLSKLGKAIRHEARQWPGSSQRQDHSPRPYGVHRSVRHSRGAFGPGIGAAGNGPFLSSRARRWPRPRKSGAAG